MNSAKNVVEGAVKDIMPNAGLTETTVHETMAKAVLHETVNKTQIEEVTNVVNKDIIQDHYHTTVQPIQDVNVLPEQHVHQVAAVQERTFEHGDDEAAITQRLQQESAKFRDEKIEGETTRQTIASPTVVGEQVHHHLHELIQPVILRDTVQATVVHTTVPIHEVHHNAPQVHSASALPAISLEDFKRQGGSLTGRDERVEHFSGVPQMAQTGAPDVGSSTTGFAATSATGTGSSFRDNDSSLTSGTGLGKTDYSSPSSTTGTTTGLGGIGSAGVTGDRQGSTTGLSGDRQGSTTGLTGDRHSSTTGLTSPHDDTTTTHKKPSLLDRLNPMKDSNGDGKAGFMK